MKWGHSPFPSKRGQASSVGTALIVALSGFLMGFDGSLFTGALVFVEQNFDLTTFEVGWAVVSHTLTATLSIFVAGPLADRFGRRAVLRAAALVFAASAVVAALSGSFGMLIVARLLSGIGVGAVLVASPMYIAEISPPTLRGRLVTLTQLFVVLGIFVAFSSSYLIVRLEDVDFAGRLLEPDSAGASWRWMLGIGALPAMAYLLALMLVPESPRWHAMHGRIDVARRILTRAHGSELAGAELAEVRASLPQRAVPGNATSRRLRDPALKGVLAIGLIVGVLQQITGINSVLAYATVMFGHLGGGASDHMPFMQTVLVGFINLVATVVALLLIDRVGRRPLFIFGSAGIAVSLLVTAFGFGAAEGNASSAWVLTGLLGFVGFFAVSLGPGLWVLLSEIFPNRIRAMAISFVGLVNSSVCMLVQFVFPWQMKNLGGACTFLIYAMFAIGGLVLLVKQMPETRGRSLEQLEKTLVGHR